ncbi:MAG: ribosome biogenesis GTPase Der [Pseudomonadota bacterium]
MLPVAVLCGRPNVGKSTLFNALTRSRDALVADFEGLTRDRRYGVAELDPGSLVLVDTGGLTQNAEGIDALTVAQARAAIDEADLLLFLVDARDGLTPPDRDFASELRRTGKPVLLVVNKSDGLDEIAVASEFAELGFDQSCLIAAAHRRGINRLKDHLIDLLGPSLEEASEEPEEQGARIAVVGRPNVGKSTLINGLIGEERLLAYDLPGTTRDSIEVPWEIDGEAVTLVDTAGVRRRARVSETVEKFSVIKALQAIENSHLVLVLLDAREGVVDQDTTILGAVLDAGKALILAVNKWDGLSAGERRRFEKNLDRKLTFVPFAHRVFISALHGSGLGELLKSVKATLRASRRRPSTRELSDILAASVEAHSPPLVRGHAPKLRYAHLGGHNPLRVVIHGSRVKDLPASYRRYLANAYRKSLKLTGVPVWLDFRSGDNPFAGRRNTLTRRQLDKRRRLKKFTKRKKR